MYTWNIHSCDIMFWLNSCHVCRPIGIWNVCLNVNKNVQIWLTCKVFISSVFSVALLLWIILRRTYLHCFNYSVVSWTEFHFEWRSLECCTQTYEHAQPLHYQDSTQMPDTPKYFRLSCNEVYSVDVLFC